MSTVRIELEDGTTVEGTVEGPIGPDLGEVIAAGPLRIALEKAEVEGHQLSSFVQLIITGPDDTEGHALSLRLPNARAARDLERRLLATGALVGIVVVGAVTATAVVPSLTTPQAPAVSITAPLPAPGWADPAVRDRGSEDGIAPLTAPAWANPAVRDGTQVESIGQTAPAAPAWTNPAVRDRGSEDGVAPLTAPARANPAVRDGMGADSAIEAPLVPPTSADPLVRDGAPDDGQPADVSTTPQTNPRAR